jgi:hypothetical protein
MAQPENGATEQTHPIDMSDVSTESIKLNAEKEDPPTSNNSVSTILSNSILSSFPKTDTNYLAAHDEGQKVFF